MPSPKTPSPSRTRPRPETMSHPPNHGRQEEEMAADHPPQQQEQQEQHQQRRQQQRDDVNPPPPTPAHTTTSRTTAWMRTHMGLEVSVEEQAEHLARRLQHSTDVLLEKLFAYLSQLPEEDDDDEEEEEEEDDGGGKHHHHDRASSGGGGGGGGGMTLPASAIGWLSSQYFPPNNNNNDETTDTPAVVSPTVWSSVALRDRLRLLRFLLPRVTHLRITRQVWPPELPNKTQRRRKRSDVRRQQQHDEHINGEGTTPRTTARRGQQPPEELNNCSVVSVSSALTIDEPPPPSTSNNSSSALPTRRAFWDYMQELQRHPSLDMRVFPRLRVLVLESIPPTWVYHLYALQPTLQVLKWNRACLYNDLPRLLFRNSSKHSSSSTAAAAAVQTESPTTSATPVSPPARITTTATTTLSTSKSHNNNNSSRRMMIYPRLTHLNLNYCGLGELSVLPKVLARCCAPHIECLSLAHNDLVSQKAALSGLRHAARLTKLNLSHNQLTSLPQAYLYLGGQLQRLQLSYNALTTVAGLDRLYALEELWLDHNCLSNLSELVGLCQLPQLKHLYLQGNLPLERQHGQTHYIIKQIWAWFQQYRQATTPQELPTLNGHAMTREQWNVLMQEEQLTTTPVFTINTIARYRRVQRLRHPQGARRTVQIIPWTLTPNTTTTTTTTTTAVVQTRRRQPRRKLPPPTSASKQLVRRRRQRLPSSTARTKVRAENNESFNRRRPASFSLQDVLISLHQEQQHLSDEMGTLVDIVDCTSNDNSNHQDGDEEKENNDDDYLLTTSLNANADVEDMWSFPLGDLPQHFSELKSVEGNEEGEDMEDTAELTHSTTTKEESHVTADDSAASQTMDMTAATPKLVNGGKKIATIKLPAHQSAGIVMFDVMTADWDDLVEKVAGGLIPDGKPRMPVPELLMPSNNNEHEGPFSLEAADLLSPESTDLAPLMPQSLSIGGRSPINDPRGGDGGDGDDPSAISSSVAGFRSNALPDLIYPDDSSVLSSLGTNRDDFPSRVSKFQIAEENAAYDGPDSWLEMNVLENLKLYFEMYVFPSSLKSPTPTDEDEVEEEDYGDGWQTIALKYPRMQLWPEDRRWLDNSSSPTNMGSPREIDDWTTTREKFVRVWAEDVIPCGKPALRRLAPNRRNRLGFHGDQLYLAGLPDPYAECRKVYLCLSSAAFYVILRADDVTKKQDDKGIKKRFPNPIPDVSKFEDAPWPHAVARHSFQELQTITIGFEFQRLILQFSNPTVRKTDPYVYVLLTSNKKATVSILQEIQRLVKEAKRETIDLNSDVASVVIENDSQLVLDSLQATVAPEVVGTILHYQVVQQRWKHGEGRGTVRRVCVVTDTKLFLMDEDYHADSHKPLDPPATGVAAVKKKNQVDLANVSYRKVDEATLKQVAEVQAAGADPNTITIVISPLSRLSRTHRWRLVCRDSVGAERLVDDVRKAMAMAQE